MQKPNNRQKIGNEHTFEPLKFTASTERIENQAAI